MVLSENRVPYGTLQIHQLFSISPIKTAIFCGTAPFEKRETDSADSAKSLMLFPSALGKVLTRQLLETIGALPGSWAPMDQSWITRFLFVVYHGIPGIP